MCSSRFGTSCFIGASLLLWIAGLPQHADAEGAKEAPPDRSAVPVGPASETPEQEDSPFPLTVDVLAGTHFPVTVGAEAVVEFPYRILAALHLGFMPGLYVDTINEVATGAGWYNDATAELVSAAIDRSFVLRFSAGIRPFPEEGFEVWLGYTLVTAGGDLASSDAVQEGSGQSVAGAGNEVPISTTLHAAHLALGWRWVIEEHFVIRVALGWVHTLASTTDIAPDFAGRPDGVVSRALRAAEDYLDEDVFQTYGFTPEIRVMGGYRF